MQENTNKSIFINTIILYVKLFITSVAGLFTTRFALQALGVDNYGLFSVVGGIISFVVIINTIMLTTTNRFIAISIGKGDETQINETFNINLIIHIVISIITLIIAYLLGDWYILNYINYNGDINTVLLIYHITIVGSVISFIGVPYNGLLIAKENFFVFSATEIFASLIKVVVSYMLIHYFTNKLLIYSLVVCFTTAYPSIVFILYCKKRYPKIVKFRFITHWQSYRDILDFSLWIGYGAIATIGKTQGAALIINSFFNTAMNAALGIANSVNSIVLMFAKNISRSISPQIIKNYASGDIKRSEQLVILSSKYSFLMLLFVSSPLLVAPEWLFSIWLGVVPEYVTIFTILIIVDALIGVFNAGIPDLIFASGKIKWYQIIINTMFLASVITSYFVLRLGVPAYFLQVVYVAFSIIILIIRQVVLNKIVKFDNYQLLIKSYIPCLTVVIMFSPIICLKKYLHPIILIFFSLTYLLLLFFFVALNEKERLYIIRKINIIKEKVCKC